MERGQLFDSPFTLMAFLPWRCKLGKCWLIHNFDSLPPERDQAIILEHLEMPVDRFTVDPQHTGQIGLDDMQDCTIVLQGISSQQGEASRQAAGQLV